MKTACAVALAAAVVAGCGSSNKKPEPKPLPANPALLGVQQVWKAEVGAIDAPLSLKPSADGARLFAAGGKGDVFAFEAATGQQLWRANVGARVVAGVGSDGERAAVVTEGNDLVTLREGQELWRQPLGARTYTAPLVAGGRVFVLTADRLLAFDGQNGARLWSQPRVGEPLVLRQGGALFALGNTLVAGVGGRLLGIKPLTGELQWQAPVAASRGANDIERLVDVVGGVSRQDGVVCARAYQVRVSCLDMTHGNVLWSKNANGYTGLGGDADRVYGTESNGRVIAWQRASGEEAWSTDAYQYRTLSAPLALGRAVAFGDAEGNLLLVSRDDGALLNRLTTDGSAIHVAPALAGNTLVVATDKGTLYGFRPQ
ncbi:MAG: outer membrane protein assembly factor BamB [Comamonas sp.]